MEKNDWLMLCQGASKNVYPSGMGLQMSKGRKAYRFRMGKPCLMTDMVDIFDPATIDEVGTIDEQMHNYQNWIKSLGWRGK